MPEKNNNEVDQEKNQSIIKQKIGEYGLINLGELYLKFKTPCKEIASKAFLALINLAAAEFKNIPLLNIFHKLLDTNGHMIFKTLYCLLLYLDRQYEVCEKIAEKSLHNASQIPDNSNYK